MREIKFRVWKPETKEWITVLGGRIGGNQSIISPDYTDSGYFVLQQYTGEKDSEGREIYEGDILEFKDKSRSVVEWLDEMSGHDYAPCWKMNDTWDQVPNTRKVVGNIFENPELCEK